MRPTMRFVAVKTPEQQAALSTHRTRDLPVKQRTQLINMIRGLLAEVWHRNPQGAGRFPVTLYKARLVELLSMVDEIRAFIAENEARLKVKD